ncbi:MAG: hypothetical protein WDO74_01670 [Pseudomonadota bacterium]
MRAFGHDFVHLDDRAVSSLVSLEREGVIYSDQLIQELDDFRHVRIRLTTPEIQRYAAGMAALDLFLGGRAKWARDVPEIPRDIAAEADAYQLHLADGRVLGPPHHCPAAFIGDKLEWIVCGADPSRRDVLDEQGTAAFLTAIRRVVDALTPAIRCFANREKGLSTWAIAREDDVRDLMYAMLRASISDIKREEPIPSRAGASRVADLHSHLAKTLVEIKWIGRKGQWRRILDEINVDIQTYSRHPDCERLFFIIVDAARDVPDPHLVETDLSGPQTIDDRRFHVRAYVREP